MGTTDLTLFWMWLLTLVAIVLPGILYALVQRLVGSHPRPNLAQTQLQAVLDAGTRWRARLLEPPPVDGEAALRRAISRLYTALKRPLPRHILVVPSPAAALLVHACLQHSDPVGPPLDLGDVYASLVRHYRFPWRWVLAVSRVVNELPSGAAVDANLTQWTLTVVRDVSSGSWYPISREDLDRHCALVGPEAIRPPADRTSILALEMALGRAGDAHWNNFLRRLGSLAILDALPDMRRTSRQAPSLLEPFVQLAGLAGSVWLWNNAAIVTPRPIQHIDEAGNLHHASTAALQYADGWGSIWAWHGMVVSRQVIEAPETMKPADILREPNITIRRIMIERFGAGRLLRETQAEVLDVDQDPHGTRTLYELALDDDEPLVMVCVHTLRKDGQVDEFFLRVPPDMRTCAEAVAWTFGLSIQAYRPAEES